MSLPSLQLDAFVAVAQVQSFSGAAQSLNITQSALSQRILNLEFELGSTLFVREPSGIRLTELGQKLLRFCQTKNSLESEFLSSISRKSNNALSGFIKIGGFSTVVRSVILPSMKHLLIEHQEIQVEFITKEIRQLPKLLETGEADLILLNKPIDKQSIENSHLGFEENVLVEPTTGKCREDVYLDHDPDDTTTADFFHKQDRAPKHWKRSYFDEIYTLIDGVLSGAGRAVIPLHLVTQTKGLKICKGYKSVKMPVYLCYYKQAFYSKLQEKTIQEISQRSTKILQQK